LFNVTGASFANYLSQFHASVTVMEWVMLATMLHALDLFRLSGMVTRKQYTLAGLSLLIVKFGVDASLAHFFGQKWTLLAYFAPHFSPLFVAGVDMLFVAFIGAASLPFIWVGVAMSVRRLRDMGVHPFWAGLFFLPFLHFAFFLVLMAVPSDEPGEAHAAGGPYREGESPPPRQRVKPPLLDKLVPASKSGAILLAFALSVGGGVFCYAITTQVTQELGIMLFVGFPFWIGFVTGICASWRVSTKYSESFVIALLIVASMFAILLAMAWEGLGCLVMLTPAILLVVGFGVLVGREIARLSAATTRVAVAVLMLPALMAMPSPEITRYSTVSEITIAASPEVVWNNVVSFPRIDAPPEPVFALAAMPLAAVIEGTGVGAMRRCIFTNGEFLEPIQVWKPGVELTFGVTAQPQQIEQYVDIKRGQFLLKDNGNGTTTIVGTTWYDLRIGPAIYWHTIGDPLLHAIHMRVLEHIKRISESPEAKRQAEISAAGPAPELPVWVVQSRGAVQ
jgi:uncharacterized membrane protein YhaH (DUF805 family)